MCDNISEAPIQAEQSSVTLINDSGEEKTVANNVSSSVHKADSDRKSGERMSSAFMTAAKDILLDNQDALHTQPAAPDSQLVEDKQQVDAAGVQTKSQRLPRSVRKRLYHEKRLAERKAQRKEKKVQAKERKQTDQETKQETEEQVTLEKQVDREQSCETHRMSKRLKLQKVRELQSQAMKDGQRVVIDCSLEHLMSHKEHCKLAQQLCRLYGHNKQLKKPAHLYFTGFKKEGQLYKTCTAKIVNFENYLVDMQEEHHAELFRPAEIVYLSPDSPNVLQSVDEEKVYIIGGLVDEHIQKGASLTAAQAASTATARLPIEEYMAKTDARTYKKVLTVNQVFGILTTFKETKDWAAALKQWVPVRQGFVLKPT